MVWRTSLCGLWAMGLWGGGGGGGGAARVSNPSTALMPCTMRGGEHIITHAISGPVEKGGEVWGGGGGGLGQSAAQPVHAMHACIP